MSEVVTLLDCLHHLLFDSNSVEREEEGAPSFSLRPHISTQESQQRGMSLNRAGGAELEVQTPVKLQ